MTKSNDYGTRTPLEIGIVVFCANKIKRLDGKA